MEESGKGGEPVMPGGGIVIIDDKEDDGRPLLRALVKGGHMATLLTANPKDLPEKTAGRRADRVP